MREDYKIKGQTVKITVEVETIVAERLVVMEKHTKHTQSEIANTALKRFISAHKDFLPQEEIKT
jgi:hypothetical protein